MNLTLLPLTEDNLIRVRFEGNVTSTHLLTGGDPVEALLGPNCYGHKVLCDMEGSRSIDSGGVCWLLGLEKRFRAAGGTIVFYSMPGIVLDVLDLLRLTPLLSLAADEAEARTRILRSSPAVVERFPRSEDRGSAAVKDSSP
jgi:hypothetical protein